MHSSAVWGYYLYSVTGQLTNTDAHVLANRFSVMRIWLSTNARYQSPTYFNRSIQIRILLLFSCLPHATTHFLQTFKRKKTEVYSAYKRMSKKIKKRAIGTSQLVIMRQLRLKQKVILRIHTLKFWKMLKYNCSQNTSRLYVNNGSICGRFIYEAIRAILSHNIRMYLFTQASGVWTNNLLCFKSRRRHFTIHAFGLCWNLGFCTPEW